MTTFYRQLRATLGAAAIFGIFASAPSDSGAEKDARFSTETGPTTVKASSGSFELTLDLFNIKLQRRESLWYRLRLKNIGSATERIDTRPFLDQWELASNRLTGQGVFIQVEGNRPSAKRIFGPGRTDYVPRGLSEHENELKQEADALASRLRKEGLSDKAILDRVGEIVGDMDAAWEKESRVGDFLDLNPGETLQSRPWFYDHESRREKAWIPPEGSNGYSELAVYYFPEPGRHRIRAVYSVGSAVSQDMDGPDWEEWKKKVPSKAKEIEEIIEQIAEDQKTGFLLTTPWVEVTVR